MPEISKYLELGTMAVSVSAMTGHVADGATAAGFSAWVDSITGSQPKVIALPGDRAKVILTQAQADQMRRWIDNQIASSMRPGEPPSLEIEFGPVIQPLLLKYALIYGIVALGAGFLIARAFR